MSCTSTQQTVSYTGTPISRHFVLLYNHTVVRLRGIVQDLFNPIYDRYFAGICENDTWTHTCSTSVQQLLSLARRRTTSFRSGEKYGVLRV